MRDLADRPDIRGHVLAFKSVAARRRLNELAVLVAQRAGKAVDLRLGGHIERRVAAEAEKASDAGDELLDLLVREDVAERQHRHLVADLGEFLRRRRADPAGQRFRADEFRKGPLQRLVALAERIIFRIRNLGRILAIIEPVVLGDLLARNACSALACAKVSVSTGAGLPFMREN